MRFFKKLESKNYLLDVIEHYKKNNSLIVKYKTPKKTYILYDVKTLSNNSLSASYKVGDNIEKIYIRV